MDDRELLRAAQNKTEELKCTRVDMKKQRIKEKEAFVARGIPVTSQHMFTYHIYLV